MAGNHDRVTTRRTRSGAILGGDERVTAEEALRGYLTPGNRLNENLSFAQARAIKVGMPADFCILRSEWSRRRAEAGMLGVRATLIGGSVVFDSAQAG